MARAEQAQCANVRRKLLTVALHGKVNSRNKSGVVGVRRKDGKWAATIGGRHLGSFATIAEAAFARIEAKKSYTPPKSRRQ